MTTSVFLNNDRTMPLLGLGLYKATSEGEAESAIEAAVQNGYRLIDTASAYKNEENVGRGIARCGIPRRDLFVTTKIWNNAQRLGDVEGAFNRSLDRLGLDYIDLYLIHWPVPGCYLSTWKRFSNPDGLFLSVSAILRSAIWKNFVRYPASFRQSTRLNAILCAIRKN